MYRECILCVMYLYGMYPQRVEGSEKRGHACGATARWRDCAGWRVRTHSRKRSSRVSTAHDIDDTRR